VLRRGLNSFLEGSPLSGEELYDLLLATCEAASNAIEHAQNPSEPFIDVHSELDDGRVSVLVRDFGQWREAVAGTQRGRGLGMMQALAETSLVTRPHGTTVTLRSRSPGLEQPDDGTGTGGGADERRPLPRPRGA
jgi:anti-sigma regulatory factor (Ser/Thr protein kinase)